MRIGAFLLAAGSSRRFGETDKLAQPFRGARLGEHAAAAIPIDRVAEAGAWVVAPNFDHPCEPAWRKAGFAVVANQSADEGMGTSVSLGAKIAAKTKLDAMLIALADMPLVPREHFFALFDRLTGPADIIASTGGHSSMPPAIFGKDHFGALAALRGDQGARQLISQGQSIACPSDWLIDIDTPDDLRTYGQPRTTAPRPAPNGE